MSVFTRAETAYLQSQPLGRLAIVITAFGVESENAACTPVPYDDAPADTAGSAVMP